MQKDAELISELISADFLVAIATLYSNKAVKSSYIACTLDTNAAALIEPSPVFSSESDRFFSVLFDIWVAPPKCKAV